MVWAAHRMALRGFWSRTMDPIVIQLAGMTGRLPKLTHNTITRQMCGTQSLVDIPSMPPRKCKGRSNHLHTFLLNTTLPKKYTVFSHPSLENWILSNLCFYMEENFRTKCNGNIHFSLPFVWETYRSAVSMRKYVYKFCTFVWMDHKYKKVSL